MSDDEENQRPRRKLKKMNFREISDEEDEISNNSDN